MYIYLIFFISFTALSTAIAMQPHYEMSIHDIIKDIVQRQEQENKIIQGSSEPIKKRAMKDLLKNISHTRKQENEFIAFCLFQDYRYLASHSQEKVCSRAGQSILKRKSQNTLLNWNRKKQKLSK